MNVPVPNFSSQTAVAVQLKTDSHPVTRDPLLAETYVPTVEVSRVPHTISRPIREEKSTAERLFEATAVAKQWTWQVAMHIDPIARKRFFRQLDSLHDEAEWSDGDRPLELDSYKAFIRAYVGRSIGGKPALALTHTGHLIAVWQSGDSKLTVEFLPNGRARCLVSQLVDGEYERFAADIPVRSLSKVLQPFGNIDWFNDC